MVSEAAFGGKPPQTDAGSALALQLDDGAAANGRGLWHLVSHRLPTHNPGKTIAGMG